MAAIGASGVVKTTTLRSTSISNSNKLNDSMVYPRRVASVRNNQRQFNGIRCCSTTSFSSSSLLPSIEIPKLNFYPREDQYDNQTFAFLIGDDNNKDGRRLHKFALRMSIRDDDGVLASKLAHFWSTFLKIPRGVDMILHHKQRRDGLTYLSQGVSSCLLEHVDSWICGYSLVAYKDFGTEFNNELTTKLEPVVDLFAKSGSAARTVKAGSTGTTVSTMELHLRVGVYGKICDRDICSREELVELLEQLKVRALHSTREDMLLHFLPLYFPCHSSKKKVDQIKGYPHLCLGKFQ